jgi:hypothetical protein
METISINKPVWLVKTDSKVIWNVFSYIVEEYNDFDLKLMKKYFETKDLDESNFTNI